MNAFDSIPSFRHSTENSLPADCRPKESSPEEFSYLGSMNIRYKRLLQKEYLFGNGTTDIRIFFS